MRRGEHAALPRADGLHGAIDSLDLVVARGLVLHPLIPVLRGDSLGSAVELLVGAVAAPELVGRGKGVEGELLLGPARRAGDVALEEGVAVGAIGEGDVELGGVALGLLYSVAERLVVALGLDHRDGDVVLVTEDDVGARSCHAPPAAGAIPSR